MKYKIEIEVEPQIINYQRGNWTWIIDYRGSEIEYRDVSLRSIQELITSGNQPIIKIYSRVSEEFYYYIEGKNYIYREGEVYLEGSDERIQEEDIPIGFLEKIKELKR